MPALSRTPSPLLALLVIVHAVVGAWAVVGLVEWTVDVPWRPITNPDLPRGLLLVHWLAMAGTAAIFFVGLARRSASTPRLMMGAYVGLALVCAYETFAVLRSPYRFASMAAEYAAYALLAVLWSRAPSIRRTFRLENSSR